ncbi:hypothetical protein ANO11243_030150 [Dothideomycetidae sp. 11243]|nr:hypothetical protein ANO11243_030150 [fungal sp. No.11243]
MSARKRNQWLEPEHDEDEFFSADEELDREDRGKAHLKSRSIKRRRIDDSASDHEDDGYSDDEELDKSHSLLTAVAAKSPGSAKKPLNSARTEDSRFARLDLKEDEEVAGDGGSEEDGASAGLLDTSKPQYDRKEPVITQAQISAKSKAKKKSGVIYLSRIPPFMKPQTIRTFLAPYGDIGKLFLTPEDDATYQRRVRSGGNKKHSYVDGWVEFLSKKDAKTVASMLNGNIMGGKKGNYYHDDIWNIKYLKGFKWDDLTEQISRENKEREARLRAEISKSKRENEAFVRDIERGKMLDTMASRKKERAGREGNHATIDSEATNDRPARHFKQKAAKEKRRDQAPASQYEKASGGLLDIL